MEPPIVIVMPEDAPHTEFEGPEFKDFKDRKHKAMTPAAVCTSCGKSITLYTHYKAVVPHPKLDVLMCRKCHGFYHSGRITQDEDGLDEQCKWCGEGGDLLVCDFCTHAFCEHCIKRNFTSKYLQKIRRLQKWHCFACDAKPLKKKVEECKRVMQGFYTESSEHECLFPNYLNENNKTIDAILSPLENAEQDPPRKCSSDQGPSHITPLTILKESENYKLLANNSKSTISSISDNEYKGKIPPKDRNSDSQIHHGSCSKVDVKTEQETNPPEDMSWFHAKNTMEQNDRSIEQEGIDKILNDQTTETVESDNITEVEGNVPDLNETSSQERKDHSEKNDLDCDTEKGDDMDENIHSSTISSPTITGEFPGPGTSASEEKFKDTESMLSIVQHFVDEWDADMQSKSETWSRPYHQYKSTSILLKKIRKIKLTVEKIEKDLKGKKKRFRNNRPSLGSASSSNDESPTKIENRRSSNEKKRVSTESSKKESLPPPDPNPPGSETSADPVNRSIQKHLVNCEVRVPLKKLTQDEIRKFSRKYSSSTTMMNSSSDYESGGNEDTDSSKAVFRRSRNSQRKKSSTSDRKPPMPDPPSDSDSTDVSDDMNDSDYFDPSQDRSAQWPGADGLCPDNDIAKNMLLQKMKDSSACKDETDSDLDESLEHEKKTCTDSDKIAKTEIKASDESGDSSSAGSTDKMSDDKKSYKHPLLKEKITSPSKRNRKSSLPSKRKKESSDENNETKLPKVIKTDPDSVSYDGTTIDVDSDLTTDSESDEYMKRTLKRRDKRSIVLSSDSDFESKENPKNEDSDSDVGGKISSADEKIINANTSDDDNSTENEDIETVKVPKKKRRRVISFDSDEENPATDVKKEIQSENEDTVVFDTPSKRLGRRNIRKIQREETLSQLTRDARRKELSRRQRLEENREIEEKEVIVITDDENLSPVKKTITVRMVLSHNPLVQVDPLLVRELKPHQLEGIRFLWENLVERVADANTKPGGGCILAHCMGLGKTLQAITFLHTVLTSVHLKTLKTALILCPYGTILNWQHEFNLWLSKCKEGKKIKIFELTSKRNIHDRMRTLEKWSRYGGVIIMGYGLFRTIMSEKSRSTRQQKEIYQRCLYSPGPDMFICDEGHILKNANSSIAQLVRQLKTKRRIILTGTPLQNNMVEYHCMVSIVKPQLLGTLKEFKNRFINPIENGQHVDSTEGDFKLMKKRAHVLHEMLAGCVQRKDYTCLRAHLNPKYEYVLSVRLSDLQIRLYKNYLGLMGNDIKLRKSCLFNDFNIFLLLACHPACLGLAKIRREDKENQEDTRNFVNDDESEESSDDDEGSSDSVTVVSDEEGLTDSVFPRTVEDLYAMSVKKLQHYINKNTSSNNVSTKNRKKLVHLATKCMNQFLNNPEKVAEYLNERSIKELKKIIQECGGNLAGCAEKRDLVFKAKSLMSEKSQAEKEWFEELIPQQTNLANANSHSGKILLMLAILRGSTEVGDKVVLFSQSLISLDIIENVLKIETENVNKGLVSPVKPYSKWYKNIDYFRLDGSTPSSERNRMTKIFNSSRELRIRLFLISTRAGGIGINLIGANRAIVFDASWNPTNDVQSIFRIYRFGQQKPCYIYRFIAQGTMEEKIYERQIIKQSLAFRVVDEQQIVRHFTASDLAELYSFKPAPKSIVRKDEKGEEIEETPDCAPPKDDILASIIKNISTRDMIVTFHEHDSLLDHQVDEELTDAERRAAWEEYDNEKRKNEEQLAVDVSSKFANIPIDGIRILLAKTQEALGKVTKSYNEMPEKSLNDIMITVRLENRAMSTDDVSEEAVKRYLNQHLAKNNSSQIKRYLEKKFDELKQWGLYKQQERHVSSMASNPPPQPQPVPRANLPTSSSTYYPPYNPTYSTKQNPYTHLPNSSTSAYPRHPNVRPGFTNMQSGAYPRQGGNAPSHPRPQTAGYRPNSAFNRPQNPRPPNPHPGGYTPFRSQNSGHTRQYGNMNGFQNSNMNRRTNSPIYHQRK